MKKLLGGILIFSIIMASSSGGYSLAQSGNSEGESLEAKVDAYLKPYLDMNCFSGAVLIAKGDRVLLSKGYGMANYDLDAPNTPKTKFKIGSITKTFTVLAIVQLAERRLLSPADKLAKYIPDYPNGDKITIDHLINHRAGIPNIENDDELAVKGYSSTEEIIKLFKNLPLDFQPGERSTYSNSGYVLLAHIIEKVSGKRYEDYLDEHVFKPAGMNDTGHDRHERVVRNKASGTCLP